MVIALIIVILLAGFWLFFLRPHREVMVERTILSDAEHLKQMQAEAEHMRCPHPQYKGRREPCKRAPGRPCVKGCTGRTNLSTDWNGK